MWQRQMEDQVKMELSPEVARSQEKASSCADEAEMKAKRPNMEAKTTANSGRPWRSMYAKMRGAWPCSPRAASVREEA